MSILDRLKEWFLKVGKLLLEFSGTVAAKFIRKYDDVVVAIVVEVAKMPELSGRERFDKAVELLIEKVPEMKLYVAQTAVQIAYATWKEAQEKIDSDGDGVPDYRDLCKDLGVPAGGCVTPDGCPDQDCDGAADHEDAEPANPDVQ